MRKYISPCLFTPENPPSNPNYTQQQKISFDDVCTYQDKFIIVHAEPGYGKTRLLQEIALALGKTDKKVLFVDLKKTEKIGIKKFIQENRDEFTEITKINRGNIAEERFFCSEGFTLIDDENTVICLDALDEVTSGMISSNVIDSIRSFVNAYPNVQVFLSCRNKQFDANKNQW